MLLPDPDTVAVAVPTLPWHYLSAAVCLTKGESVHERGDASATHDLLDDLSDLVPAALLASCAPDQSTDDGLGLFAYVRKTGRACGKAYYAWPDPPPADAPPGLPVRLRAGTFAPYLGPSALVLPWPFPAPDGPALAATYEAARLAAGKQPTPAPGPGEFTTAGGLPLQAFMLAVDDAIDPDSPSRSDFEKVIDDPKRAKEWIVARAQAVHGGPASYPDSLTVHVDPAKTTPETAWEVRAGHLHLELGWQPHPDREVPTGPIQTMVDQWPCGAFTGYHYDG
jgi:hypothetical protein